MIPSTTIFRTKMDVSIGFAGSYRELFSTILAYPRYSLIEPSEDPITSSRTKLDFVSTPFLKFIIASPNLELRSALLTD